MNDFNDINTIIEDYPFNEDNPFVRQAVAYMSYLQEYGIFYL